MFERRHDGGNVGEDDVGEAKEVKGHAGGSAACAEFDGAAARGVEVKEVRVGVGGGVGEWGPAFDEFGED